MSNLSRTAEMTTSIMLISEVIPAITSEPKNSTPISAPAGASLMIAGKAMNASPTPPPLATSPTGSPLSWAMNPRAANTPMPASSSKPEFEKPTTSPEPILSLWRSTYEAYVIMMPKPIDSEKKIWPNAAAQTHTVGSASALQPGVNSASRPLPAPSSSSATTTSAPKAQHQHRDEDQRDRTDPPLHAQGQHHDDQRPHHRQRHHHPGDQVGGHPDVPDLQELAEEEVPRVGSPRLVEEKKV